MMTVLLFSFLAASIVGAYIPWDERIVRIAGAVTGAGASIVATLLAHEAWVNPHRSGWANMWNLDGTAAMMLALIVPAYIAAYILAERVLTRDHLEGSLSLIGFRHAFAALHASVAVMFALALTTHIAVAIAGTLCFVALCVMTYRCRKHLNVRPFALVRDGAFVAVLSAALLRLAMVAPAGAQNAIWIGCLVVGLIGTILSVALTWKRAHMIGEAAVFFAISMTILALGLGAAGIIATAMLWFALLLTAVIVHVGATVDWARSFGAYVAIGMPPAALAIPYLIAFGYGLQLHPWVTGGALVAYVVFLCLAAKTIQGLDAGKWSMDRTHGLLASALVLNIALAIALSTPQVMLLIINGVSEITAPQF